jgi:hypothetical protein
MSALLDGVSAVGVVGDDPVATRAVARGLGRIQAERRKVYIADLLGDDAPLAGDDRPGVSDMVRYGVSLSRAARSDETRNVYLIDGGAESPLAEDVLSSARWKALSEQVHRAGSLLLLAVPARVPGVESLLVQLDGVLLVGDVEAPPANVRVLGEVRTAATMRTPALATRSVPPGSRRRLGAWWPALAGAAGLLLVVLAVPTIRQRVASLISSPPATAADSVMESAGSLATLPPVAPRVTSDAAWSVELFFTNSESDALGRAQQLADTLPAATFAEMESLADSATWFRVMGGAFADSISAENYLAVLRSRGTIPPTAGGAIHTPYALLVDSTRETAMARVQVAGYYGRGLPAYALRDSVGWWRVYVGAFSQGAGAMRLQQRLDSLNIQSALAVRAGSPS